MKYLVKFNGKTVLATYDRTKAIDRKGRYPANQVKLVIVPVVR